MKHGKTLENCRAARRKFETAMRKFGYLNLPHSLTHAQAGQKIDEIITEFEKGMTALRETSQAAYRANLEVVN